MCLRWEPICIQIEKLFDSLDITIFYHLNLKGCPWHCPFDGNRKGWFGNGSQVKEFCRRTLVKIRWEWNNRQYKNNKKSGKFVIIMSSCRNTWYNCVGENTLTLRTQFDAEQCWLLSGRPWNNRRTGKLMVVAGWTLLQLLLISDYSRFHFSVAVVIPVHARGAM